MSRNIAPQFVDPEMAVARQVKELNAFLQKLKAQQAPTIRFTDVSTVSFSMLPTNPDVAFQLATTIHAIIATLHPPQNQVLFAVPEIDAFETLGGTPLITSDYLWPLSDTDLRAKQFFDLSQWYDYYNSDGKDIVAKIYTRDRIFTEFSDSWGATSVTLALRWRYLTPGVTT